MVVASPRYDAAVSRYLSNRRVALVHDWLVTWRGGEKVLAALAQLFPEASIYTLFHEPGSMPPVLESRRPVTSLLDAIPSARRHHRWMLPLMPLGVRTLTLPADTELVISSSHCAAKAVPIPPGAKHLSYVHAPLRYMWDRFDDYFGAGKAGLLTRLAARAMRPALQRWDVATSSSVDAFVANSAHVAAQIQERYHRTAQVIYPPVELERFLKLPLDGAGQGGYFLCFGALAPYKRVDLAIEAMRGSKSRLIVAGAGQASARWLRDLPPNVEVLGQVSDAEVPSLMRNARALIFPGVEDFGLTPVEMQACGRPVIAFARGGALETITPETGVFFDAQTPAALASALEQFETFEAGFSPAAARRNAQRFTLSAFHAAISEALQVLTAVSHPSEDSLAPPS